MKGNIFFRPTKGNCKILIENTLKNLRMLTQVSIISKTINIKFDLDPRFMKIIHIKDYFSMNREVITSSFSAGSSLCN
jgi:hypothetical protein